MGYAEDVDRVCAYVRTEGRGDYRRMRDVSGELVQVEFIANSERHAAAIALLVDDPKHVRVIEANTSADHAQRAQRYWDPIREQLAGRMNTDGAITHLGFGHDDAGPLLFVGISPFSAEAAARTAEIFAPHRVRVEDRSPITPAATDRSPLEPLSRRGFQDWVVATK